MCAFSSNAVSPSDSSIVAQLTPVLPLVQRPIRYTGSEYGRRPNRDQARVKVCLAFPDVYEIGMSNYGLRVIRHFLARVPGVEVDRVYSPWPDLATELAARNIPLFGVETRRPLGEFDIIGISLQSELCYTNVLAMLAQAKIPARRAARDGRHPLLIAGGPCTLNPLPMLPFFDAFAVGDGEEVIVEMVKDFTDCDRTDRAAVLDAWSRRAGVLVPARRRADTTVTRRTVAALRADDVPFPPLVPVGEITHDRLTVEIARGCTRGCRFCQAGMVNRPTRFRPRDEIVAIAERGIRASGWEEVSLLSLSSLDYPDLEGLLFDLVRTLGRQRVAISLPSVRGECFDATVARQLAAVKKTGLTFAPETGSAALACAINKEITLDDLGRALHAAHEAGWRSAKFYFMIGLPGETEDDVRALARFAQDLARPFPGRIRVSVSPFVPKPHTPLQWAGFLDRSELAARMNLLGSLIRNRKIDLKREHPEVSFMEALLARGDERLAPVIEQVTAAGGSFQHWSEFFNFGLWQQALADQGLDPDIFLRSYAVDEPLPWGFVNAGVSAGFLAREYGRYQTGERTPDCRTEACTGCQACPGQIEIPSRPAAAPAPTTARATPGPALRWRLRYAIDEPLRFAGHLDLVRAWYRALRRSALPLLYTAGFAPRPQVSFGPPRPVGVTSRAEYLDVALAPPYAGNIVRDLNPFLPEGLMVTEARLLAGPAHSLGKLIDTLQFDIRPPGGTPPAAVDRTPGVLACAPQGDGIWRLVLAAAPRVHLFDAIAALWRVAPTAARTFPVERTACLGSRAGQPRQPMEDS